MKPTASWCSANSRAWTRSLIEAIKPEVLIKGADYKREQVVGGDFVESHGGKVVLVDLVKGRSTTNIIRKISGNNG